MTTKRVSKSESYDVWVGRDYHNGKQFDLGKFIRHKKPRRGWLGNPYRVQDCGRREAIRLFERDLSLVLQMKPWARHKLLQLYGKRLACHCGPNQDCHGDVIVRKVNALYWKNKSDGLPAGKQPGKEISEW